MRRSLKGFIGVEEQQKFKDLMSEMSRDIPPLSKRDESSLRRIERDLERRAFAKLNPEQKPGMFESGLDAAYVLVPLCVAVGCLVAAIVWSI